MPSATEVDRDERLEVLEQTLEELDEIAATLAQMKAKILKTQKDESWAP